MFGRPRHDTTGPDGSGRSRLDPVRWRRPGRGTLIRITAVAALLVVAALVVWSRPIGCAPADRPSPAGRAAPRDPSPSGTATSGAGLERPRTRVAATTGATADRPVVPAGTVGVPVRPAEPATLALVRLGDRVDLLGVHPAGGRAVAVADDALVIGVTGADDPLAGGLLLALDPAAAKRAVGVAERTRFAVVIRPAS